AGRRGQALAGGAGGRTATEPPESEAEGQSPTKENPADDSPTAVAVSAADGMVAWLVPASGLPVNGETPMALEGNGLADDGNPERSEEHTSELQSRENLVCRLLLEKKKKKENNANVES